MSERLVDFRFLADAIDVFAALDPDMWTHTAPHLTCTEVEALAAVFEAIGLNEHARYMLAVHRDSDAPGDMHHPDFVGHPANPADYLPPAPVTPVAEKYHKDFPPLR